MIYIKEIFPPRKVSGISSLLVAFQYKEEVVNALKTLPLFYYHKKDYCWEIPINNLTLLLDTITFFDDIQLELLPDLSEHLNTAEQVNSLYEKDTDENRYLIQQLKNKQSNYLTNLEIENFKFKPFNHQIEGINFGLTHNKWLMLDSMGLGKTNQIIWLAETLKNRKLIEHCLIVCGIDSLRQNWKKEIKKFSNESCIVLGEKITKTGKVTYNSVSARIEQLKNPIEEFFIIVNAATLRNDKIIDAFNKSKNKINFIAVDECHKFATKSSQQGSNLLKLKSDYKVAATGTLLVNSPISCYMPLAWTENDHATLTMYKAQYCNFGGFNNSQIVGYKNLDLLKEEIDACSIRRTLEEVRDDMPAKNIKVELIELSDEHKKFYEAIKQGVKEEADKINLNSSNLLALTTRLRQATACPSILTTQNIISSKVERCVEIVEELVAQGEKVVVLSTFKEPVYQLAELLKKYNPLVNTGDISDDLVSKNVDLFQTDPSVKIFLGSHAKCGTGITLNAASYLICIDTPYTYAQFSQSTDRIWRVNNTRPAFITVLQCMDTIDERVWQIVNTKKDLSEYVIDNIENELSKSLKDEMFNIIKDL